MSRKLRVLSVSHTAVSRAAGRLRYLPIAADPAIELALVVPARWYQFGRWMEADRSVDPDLHVAALPILLPRAGPASWYLHIYPGLGRVARALRPEVIHLWEEPWSRWRCRARCSPPGTARRWCWRWTRTSSSGCRRPFEAIRRHVLRRTDLLLCRSAQAEAVARAAGYRGPARPIGYGVDRTVFRPGAPPSPMPPLRLGYAGRIVEEKGLDDVLDAMGQSRAPVELAILGAGPHEAALRRRAAELAGRVTFRPWGEPEEVAAFLRGLHALVLPTRTTSSVKEQFGRVIIEAQACGVPVIGSSSGAIPEVIGAGGWVVPERDPAALATLLERLAAAPDEVRARGEAGRANVARRFTLEAVAAELVGAWRQAAAFRAGEARQRPALVAAA